MRRGRVGYSYDPAQRVGTLVDSVGTSIQHAFDPLGRLTAAKDPLGRVTRLTYGSSSELTGVEEASGERAQYVYDPARHLVKVIDPTGAETQYAHDAMGNVVSRTDPLGQSTRMTYDPASRMTSITNPDGRTTRFTYDAAHRLVRKDLPGGGSVSYRYDAVGNLLHVDDGVNPVTYEYDALGRLANIQYPSIGKTVRYEYDARGLRSKLVLPDGREIQFQYDQGARLTAVAAPDGRLARLTYDPAGRPTGVQYPNGVRGRYEYDPADRPVSIRYEDQVGRMIAGWRYAYDAAGNRVEVRDATGPTTTYRYDTVGQLVEASGSQGILRYSYLPGGDRQQEEVNGRAVAYRYDAAHRLLEAGPLQFAYDTAGNMIRRRTPEGTTGYVYDDEGRLVEVTRPAGGVTRFGYAASGERLWRQEASTKTLFLYDGINLLGEMDAAGHIHTLYLHGPGVDMPLAAGRADGWYYLHADALGSVSTITTDGGRVIGQARYEPFGVRTMSGSFPGPFGFAAREWEPSIGLYYHRARYYDPGLGRFLSTDPVPPSLTDLRSLHPYLYANNNPLRFTDPLGLAPGAPEAERITAWLVKGGFWNSTKSPVNFNKSLDAYAETSRIADTVQFGPAAASSFEAAVSTAFHEWIHRMQNQRLAPLVDKAASAIQQMMQRELAVARIQAQGGMLHGAAGGLRTVEQILPPHTSGRTITNLWRQGALDRNAAGELVANPLPPQARSAIVKELQREGSLVGQERVLQMGLKAAEREAYAAEAAFNTGRGFIGEGFTAIAGFVEHGGSKLAALWMGTKLLVVPLLKVLGTVADVYTVGSALADQYNGFQAAREIRGLEWQDWKNQQKIIDMQDSIVEHHLRTWLTRHPEAIQPGMKIEDAIAKALENLHNARPPFENVVATTKDLEAERDRLRRELDDAKRDVENGNDEYSKLVKLRQEALKTIETWQQHQRDRTKILEEFAKLPASAQQQRQADIKRIAGELGTVKKELKTANERLNQIENAMIAANTALKGFEYHRQVVEDALKKADEKLTQAQKSGARQ